MRNDLAQATGTTVKHTNTLMIGTFHRDWRDPNMARAKATWKSQGSDSWLWGTDAIAAHVWPVIDQLPAIPVRDLTCSAEHR